MEPRLETVAERLYVDLMAPVVLGGVVRPGRVIGLRAALALGAREPALADTELERRVQAARVRQARKLVPVDRLGPPSGSEWVLAAVLHDLLQCVNPRLDRALRRRAAARILDGAQATIERVRAPAHVLEALSRHTWLARLFEIRRTDTVVTWWSGSRTFLGVEASPRLLAWPKVRRVRVERSTHTLSSLAPLAIDRERLVTAVRNLLFRTPLTDIATCTRVAPPFAWGDATLALVATPAGRTVATRALARLPSTDVDAALGRATREALALHPGAAGAAVALLADRAIAQAQAQTPLDTSSPDSDPMTGFPPAAVDAAYARDLGATAAKRALKAEDSLWPESDRRRLLTALSGTSEN